MCAFLWACVGVRACVRVCVCVCESFGFHVLFCFVVFLLGRVGGGGGKKGKGIAEMTVSHIASNKIHGKILHLWNKCLLEKHVLLLFSCC